MIEVFDLRTGNSATVDSDPRINLTAHFMNWQPAVSWAADGRIVFTLPEGRPNIDSNAWAVRVDSGTGLPKGKPVRLTSGPGEISSFSITADGKRLAFIKNSLQPQVYVAELDPATKTLNNSRRLTLDQRANFPWTWTKDSRFVIFSSNRNGRFEIFKQAIDQTTPEVLASEPARNEFIARLTPDGSSILYNSYPVKGPPPPPRIMRLALAGGPPQTVLEAPDLGNLKCASAPSTICYFLKEDGAGNTLFYTLDPLRGTSKEFLKLPADQVACSDIAPDASFLATCVLDAQVGRIHLYSFKDGSIHDLLVKGWPGLDALDWAPDSKSMFVSTLRPDGTVVLIITDLEGNARIVLEQRNGNAMCWAQPSPDGKRLAVMQMNGESNAWMLEGF